MCNQKLWGALISEKREELKKNLENQIKKLEQKRRIDVRGALINIIKDPIFEEYINSNKCELPLAIFYPPGGNNFSLGSKELSLKLVSDIYRVLSSYNNIEIKYAVCTINFCVSTIFFYFDGATIKAVSGKNQDEGCGFLELIGEFPQLTAGSVYQTASSYLKNEKISLLKIEEVFVDAQGQIVS